MSPQRRGGLRSGTDKPKGRTRDQLYNEATSRNIKGRSKMNKGQLKAAVDRRRFFSGAGAVVHHATLAPATDAPRLGNENDHTGPAPVAGGICQGMGRRAGRQLV